MASETTKHIHVYNVSMSPDTYLLSTRYPATKMAIVYMLLVQCDRLVHHVWILLDNSVSVSLLVLIAYICFGFHAFCGGIWSNILLKPNNFLHLVVIIPHPQCNMNQKLWAWCKLSTVRWDSICMLYICMRARKTVISALLDTDWTRLLFLINFNII